MPAPETPEPEPSSAAPSGDATPVVTEEPEADAPVESPVPAPEAPAPAPALVPEAPKVINPCRTCGRELAYLEAYDRYYCYNCMAYAPPVVKVEAVPAPPKIGKPCPTCGRELTFIPEYNRHYCYHCKKYAAAEGKAARAPQPAPAVEVIPPKPEATPTPAPPPAVEIVAVRNPCPTCGRELTYIAKYGRFYCYSCRKYAPAKPRNPCPNCGKDLTFIALYQRHYCPACGQYAPKELTVQILASRSAAVAASMAAARSVAVARSVAAAPVHQHGGNPGGGVALAIAGLIVLLMYEFLWALPIALGTLPVVNIDAPAAPTIAGPQTLALGSILQLAGLLMIGLGIIVGLVRLRTMR